jgi:hypothetical protein
MDNNSQIIEALSHLKAITLEEMNAVALMKRLDTKFILSVDRLSELLTRVKDDYALLTINGENIFDYRTTYYDTEELETYTDHLRGKSIRHKVRIREYINTQVSYFEIKKKQNSGVTDKVRIQTEVINPELESTQTEFFNDHIDGSEGEEYSKVLTNTFNRITLANPEDKERVTIDFNLGFKDEVKTQSFANLCIVEIKQPRINRFTPIFRQLKLMGIRPLRISKYCLGVTTLQEVKSNLFKPKLRTINKIINSYGNI